MALSVWLLKLDNLTYNFTVEDKNHLRRVNISRELDGDTARFKISTNDIMYSAIYDSSSRIRNEYGNDRILIKLKNILNDTELEAIFINNENISIAHNISLSMIYIYNSKGSVTMSTKFNYKAPKGKYILNSGIKKYKSKTLDYFKSIKNLNLDKKDFRCLRTKEEFLKYCEEVLAYKPKWCAKDTETTGLRFFYDEINRDKIVGISHSYKEYQGVYIPIRYKGEILTDVYEVYECLKPIWDIDSFYQNGDFDGRVFKSLNLPKGKSKEFMILLQLINPDPIYSKALKEVAQKLLKEDTIELDEILGKDFDAELVEFIDLELMTVYACQDTEILLRCANILYAKLEDREKSVFQRDQDVYEMVSLANWYGLPIREKELSKLIRVTKKDLDQMHKYIINWIKNKSSIKILSNYLRNLNIDIKTLEPYQIQKLLQTKEIQDAVNKINKGFKSEEFDLNYTVDKKKILYDILDYPKLVYTEKGGLSTGKDLFNILDFYELEQSSNEFDNDLFSSASTILNLKEQIKLFDKNTLNKKAYPLAYMLKQYSTVFHKLQVYKRLSSVNSDGRYLSTYRFTNIITSRLSSDVQIIPKYAKDVIGFEEEDEWGCIVFDYDQVEVRGFHNEAIRMWNILLQSEFVSEDTKREMRNHNLNNIIDIFNNDDKDLYIEQSALFFEKQPYEVTSEERTIGKTAIIGSQYGSTPATMAENELRKASSDEERENIINLYKEVSESYFWRNLHIKTYMEYLATICFEEQPEDKKPYNLSCNKYGSVFSLFGRKRYFNLDNMDNKIQWRYRNQTLNFPTQAGCRDIVMFAISDLMKEIYKCGVSEKDIYADIFVHDESVLLYRKSVINPEWVCAMIYKYANVQIKGHPIKYTCSPAVVSNWKEGKLDKYSIPKEVLRGFDTDINSYTNLDVKNHKKYFLDKITKYYQDKCYEKLLSYKQGDEINLNSFKVTDDYKLYRTIKNFYSSIVKVSDNVNINMLIELGINSELYKEENIILGNCDVSIKAKEQINKISEHSTFEFSEPETELDLFDLGLTSDYIDEEELSENFIKCNINTFKLKQLDIKHTVIKNEEEILHNIFERKYTPYIYINFDTTDKGSISKIDIDKVVELCRRNSSEDGKNLSYKYESKIISTDLKLSKKVSLKKLDDLITSLRS